MMIRAVIAAAVFLSLLSVCAERPKAKPVFYAIDNPVRLSEWGLLEVKDGALNLGQDVLPYSLNTPLFTDYAHKLRTIWMKEGRAEYNSTDILDFPIGTIISKTFYYPSTPDGVVKKTADLQPVTQQKGLALANHHLIETRLLVHREAGWEPLSYVWNEDQSDAKLTRIGDLKTLALKEAGRKTDFSYLVPNINQCAGCHAPNNTTRELKPIGPKARHLNGVYNYTDGPMNQIDKWLELGYLSAGPEHRPQAAIWDNQDASLDARARAYLDINCAHCHNPVGPADTSGLHLNPDNESQPHLGICKNAVAAGSGTGGRKYDITPGEPDNSIFLYRMETRDPSAMMPELGRSLVHDEGVKLIADWISDMAGGCE